MALHSFVEAATSYVHDHLLATAVGAPLVLFLSLHAMGIFHWTNHFKTEGKHCYIGGGSEGLGLALACELAKRGAHVTIVSRSQDKLTKAIEEIETHRRAPTQRFQSFSCDLTVPSTAASTLHAACEPFSSAPDYIFACAGASTPGYFTEISADDHIHGMDINFRSALCTVHEGIRRMKDEGKQGHVIFTASILAMMGFAGYSSYCPSKYAIRGLADSLRNELLMYGIGVHLALPGTIFTRSFYEVESLTKPELTKKIEGPDEGMSAEGVAKKVIAGLERNEFYITYDPIATMLRNSRGIVPRNNVLLDTLWGVAGTIGFPIWRILTADAMVKKEGNALRARKILPALRK